MSVKPPCPDCGHVHTAADIYAVGRFSPGGPIGYCARYPGAPSVLVAYGPLDAAQLSASSLSGAFVRLREASLPHLAKEAS